ncbi:MAG: hypothetical protein OEZ04_06605, partial [Nitrospinota bacterium]|nr:hypothetical protein [Nitrospinota bacterium]
MKTSAICMTLLFFATGAMAAAESLTISRITPSGAAVEAVRQIVIQFGQPVVPLGRMERKDSEIPITIQPALDCHWRWVDRSALACQLGDKEKMSLATTYKVTVRPGIRTEGG